MIRLSRVRVQSSSSSASTAATAHLRRCITNSTTSNVWVACNIRCNARRVTVRQRSWWQLRQCAASVGVWPRAAYCALPHVVKRHFVIKSSFCANRRAETVHFDRRRLLCAVTLLLLLLLLFSNASDEAKKVLIDSKNSSVLLVDSLLLMFVIDVDVCDVEIFIVVAVVVDVVVSTLFTFESSLLLLLRSTCNNALKNADANVGNYAQHHHNHNHQSINQSINQHSIEYTTHLSLLTGGAACVGPSNTRAIDALTTLCCAASAAKCKSYASKQQHTNICMLCYHSQLIEQHTKMHSQYFE